MILIIFFFHFFIKLFYSHSIKFVANVHYDWTKKRKKNGFTPPLHLFKYKRNKSVILIAQHFRMG